MTKEELLNKLPQNKDYWLVAEMALAFDVSTRTIQYAAKRKGIGTKVRQGPRGTYVFQPHDLDRLLQNIHGEAGNPVIRAQKLARERMVMDRIMRNEAEAA